MRVLSTFLAVLFATSGLTTSSDPFVGTWVYNAEKSPKPTITYGIRDLGGDRYALTEVPGELPQSGRTASPSSLLQELRSPLGSSMTTHGRWTELTREP